MNDAQQRHRQLVLVTMCAGYFLVLLDVTIVNVALPSIGGNLHASVDDLQWIVDGYAIALASLMLGAGTAGDRLGHKRIVLAGLALFGVASLGCALAPSIGVLVAARVVQGVGAAMLLPGTLAVIGRAFPDTGERARAIGTWAAIGGAALPAGPLLGGVLVQAIGWRAVFAVNLPIVLVAGVVSARIVRDTSGEPDRRLDRSGTLLGAAALAGLTATLIAAGRSGLSVPALVAALLALVAFALREARASDPMLPLALFRRPAFTVANAVAGAMNLGTLGLLFVLTLYLQGVKGHSALVAGVALLPLFLPLAVLAPLSGRLTARAGSRIPMAAGLLAAAAGALLLLVSGRDSGYAVLLPGLLLWGGGVGVLTPAVVAAAVGAVPTERSGLGSAVNNTARQVGGAIGIAAFGALAGRPQGSGFVAGFHLAAGITAALWLAAALATLTWIPATRPS